MIIEIPMIPPSVNHAYKRARNKRLFLSKEAKDFQQVLTLVAQQAAKKENWELISKKEFFKVCFEFEFKDRRFPDPNNLLKILIDTLQGIIYDNDKYLLPNVTSAKVSGSEKTKIIIER